MLIPELAADAFERLRKQEEEAVAYALPAHMLFLMFDQCRRKGWELRMDVVQKLNESTGVPLSGKFDSLAISRLATKIDETAVSLLNTIAPDDPVDGLHIVAMFVLILIDEALLGDPRAIVVVTSLLLMEDLKQGNADWPFKETFLRREAKRLLHAATLLGFYKKRMRDTPITIDG